MDSKELRIGNYVDCNGIVSEIVETRTNYVRLKYFRKDVEKEHISLVLLDDRVKEIPLTEEWLLKFGYVKFNVNASIYCEYSLVIDDVLKYKLLFDYRDLGITMPNTYKPIRLKYVHQLQNLYFALTGNELIFKDK
jgi:hypothetical protein